MIWEKLTYTNKTNERNLTMASLTHVCMWSNDGWKRITAQQAAEIHPGGTVSSHSGLFMCELCGQYVLLTNGGYQVRHFRHSSSEKSKDCPERTQGTSFYYSYNSIEHELPIRLTNISTYSFQLELGLIRIPKSLATKDLQIKIQTTNNRTQSFVYNRERINTDSLSYVSIGDSPSEKYILTTANTSDDIYNFWPRYIYGINSNGTLFDHITGKRLITDSDIELGKTYFLLSTQIFTSTILKRSGIIIEEKTHKKTSYNNWYIYLITATEMNENAAKFFLNIHYRLTAQPIQIQPVWPPYVEGDFVIKHNSDVTTLLIKGNAPSIKSFPLTTIHHISSDSVDVYSINCHNRQQLISAGRTKALQYTYFWRESITDEQETPEFSITDISGTTIEPGTRETLPPKGIMRVFTQYDGEILIKSDGVVVEKKRIQAETLTEIDQLSSGMDICIFIGLDKIWELVLAQKNKPVLGKMDEDLFIKELDSLRGVSISTPHSLRNIARYYRNTTKVYQWIMKRINEGFILSQALKKLQFMYRSEKMKCGEK